MGTTTYQEGQTENIGKPLFDTMWTLWRLSNWQLGLKLKPTWKERMPANRCWHQKLLGTNGLPFSLQKTRSVLFHQVISVSIRKFGLSYVCACGHFENDCLVNNIFRLREGFDVCHMAAEWQLWWSRLVQFWGIFLWIWTCFCPGGWFDCELTRSWPHIWHLVRGFRSGAYNYVIWIIQKQNKIKKTKNPAQIYSYLHSRWLNVCQMTNVRFRTCLMYCTNIWEIIIYCGSHSCIHETGS